MQGLSDTFQIVVRHLFSKELQRMWTSQSAGYLDGELCRGGPVGRLEVLRAGCKVVKAVLLLQQMAVLPPLVAILAATPAQAELA